jgi:putative FmdB family regulatory protein
MPIYQYKCENCDEQFDVIQKFADEPLTVHVKCGGHVHRMMTAPAFQFKGTGWYVTDYANKKSSSSDSNSGSSESKSESKSDSNSESKSDTKSESKSETKSESKSETKSDSSTASPAPAAPAKA